MTTILIVDDSLADRRLAAGLLQRSMDCTFIEADSGEAAIEQLASVEPDLILTDLQMPRMNGLELVERIRDDYPAVPVVLMTARGSEETAAQALQVGAASYVPKKRLASDLIPTVQRILTGVQQERTHSRLMHHLTRGKLEFTLHNDPALIPPLVRTIQEMLRSVPLGEEGERMRVGVGVEEAIRNAIIHGNLEIDPEDSASSSVDQQVAERAWMAPWHERRVEVVVRISRDEAVFEIRDEGPGFDPTPFLSDAFDGDEHRGRGIHLMRTFMDDVSFEDGGRRVVLRKRSLQEVDEIADD